MESLRVLSLTGNSVISKIKNYRKTLTIKCKELRNLDERPIFKKDRLCAEAWSTGGIEAEQAMRTKLNEDEQKTISDSVNALMSLRRNRNVQIIPSASGDSGHREGGDVRDSTDSLIVSKDYYDECDSSDDDSTDDGSSVKDANPLVREIDDNNDCGDDSAAADDSVDRSTRDNVGDNGKGFSDPENDIVDYPRDRMSAADRSTCITTVDCSSGSREDIDAGRPLIIAFPEDGDELAERLDEKYELFVDSKTDASPNNIASDNTAEPSLEQCTDDRLCSNDSAELTIELIENELVSTEMNYANDESNPDESGKLDDDNSDENHNNKNVLNNQKNVVDYPRDRMPAGDRSTCITTVDCSSGSREDIDAGRPLIIAFPEDGDELAERLDEKYELFVDSKTDASPNNVPTNNTAEPSLEQCTDDRLCSNDSAELTIELIENEFVSTEMNYANDESNPDESGKLDDDNSDENYNNNNVVNNHHRNVGSSIDINNTLKDNDSETCKNPDLNERQGLPILCAEQIINTSQILCTERLYTLDIIDHDNAEEESSLISTCKPDRNEIKEIPIQLPWLLPPQTKEEFYIKKSSE
ncbi:unnamed protein product [Macrosiphum euphorbiae]|uniref:Dynein assembly factor 1, axonemal homolog n=1 Tax=Macrosiphum euphorbiae TaxID=13131 RepID=A0AAV0VHT1_9HEMI|nr:unnamed protein product [Macrosiphum euphorbiae]